MSGGHWEYKQYQVEELLSDIGRDPDVSNRFPKLAKVFSKMSKLLGEVIHELDWDLSADSSIDDDEKFDNNFIIKMQKIVGRSKELGELQKKVKHIIDKLEEE